MWISDNLFRSFERELVAEHCFAGRGRLGFLPVLVRVRREEVHRDGGLESPDEEEGGILFNLGPAGDYYALRANCLEDNLILWQVKAGRRSEVKGVSVPVPAAGRWHELKLTVKGHHVVGSLNGKQYLVHDLHAPISGKVGIWSKSDSRMLFNAFSVSPD